jgi:hypothetical protein
MDDSQGLVLAREDPWGHSDGLSLFHRTTGILKDLFRDENDDSTMSSSWIFIPRPSPIECKACRGVMLDSYPALVSHCEHWSHRQKMDEEHDQRVPEAFVDPRNTKSYHQHSLSLFQKVMALKTFEYKFIALLHAPVDLDGIDNLMGHRGRVLHIMAECVVDCGELMRTVTFEKVREACIEFVLIAFYRNGIEGRSLDVVLGGWQAFGCYEIGSWNRLHSIITGTSLTAEE